MHFYRDLGESHFKGGPARPFRRYGRVPGSSEGGLMTPFVTLLVGDWYPAGGLAARSGKLRFAGAPRQFYLHTWCSAFVGCCSSPASGYLKIKN